VPSFYLIRRFITTLFTQGPVTAFQQWNRWRKQRRSFNLNLLDPAHPWIQPDTDLRAGMTPQTPEEAQFKADGEEFLRYFKAFCELTPDSRVLDVGCGIGRMAFPLTEYLSLTGRYDGFDIIKSQIEWCQAHITSKYPNFHFRHLDVYNRTYNPRGQQTSTAVRFPYDDHQFDLVFLTSIFTHMLPADVDHYLGEIARVLRPGKYVLFTMFLLNAEAERWIAQNPAGARYTFPKRYPQQHYAVMDAQRPEDAIAFEELFVRQLCNKHSLHIQEPVRYGAWSGRSEYLSGQDIVIATKA
jgi:SAM-dependent methyltransferase